MASNSFKSSAQNVKQMKKRDYIRVWAYRSAELLVQDLYQHVRNPKDIDIQNIEGISRLRAILSGKDNLFDYARPKGQFVHATVPEMLPLFISQLAKRKPEMGNPAQEILDKLQKTDEYQPLELVA